MTSNAPASSQRLTRPPLRGPNVRRATEPLYRTGIALPEETRYGGRTLPSSAGAITLTS